CAVWDDSPSGYIF
nr:immunoglobulin light chain junction region [Macaca mulatta]MPO08775.1 immunoglobulin light chain junction region [Macaca mulatta]MPO09084.1 immunoglobulin light chain junction region [Macaca mulatta]